jgi:hypothetical protein
MTIGLKGGGRLAALSLAGALAGLLVACSGVKQSDLDALKQQVAQQEQAARASQQQLNTKLQESAAANKALAEGVDKKFVSYDANLPLWRIQPGTAPRMRELTESFNLMWFAAQSGNWEFAGFERYRADEEVKTIAVTRPARAQMLNDWAEPSLKALEDAIKAKDRLAFEKAYDNAIAGCNACHSVSKGGGFAIKAIKVTRPAEPLYPNLDYKGPSGS